MFLAKQSAKTVKLAGFLDMKQCMTIDFLKETMELLTCFEQQISLAKFNFA